MRATRLLTALAAAAVLAGCSSSSPSPAAIQTPVTDSPTPGATSAAPSAAPTSASPSPDELSPKPPLESAPPLGRPVCKGSALTVADADSLVDPQSTREVYAIRTSGPDCQLQGYPSVTFQDSSGRSLAVAVTHSGFGVPAGKAQPVTLSRSTSLSFEIGSARTGACANVTHVTVTLPGTSPAHRVSSQWQVCAGKAAVSPVLRRGNID
ncbi:MAG: hypothetical protein JWN31_521 [Frankiales bacterium]|nr:hypothetical protein [Frankiales bacterium]